VLFRPGGLRLTIGRFLRCEAGFAERRKSGVFRLTLTTVTFGNSHGSRNALRCCPRGTRLHPPEQALQLQHCRPQPQKNEASDNGCRAGGNQRVAGAELIDWNTESDHGDTHQDRHNPKRQWNQVHADRSP
jgi:hypothetical protein